MAKAIAISSLQKLFESIEHKLLDKNGQFIFEGRWNDRTLHIKYSKREATRLTIAKKYQKRKKNPRKIKNKKKNKSTKRTKVPK